MTNFVLMGDIHSVYSRFELALNYIENNVKDYHLIMLGDVFDSRCSESNSVQLYHAIRDLQKQKKASLIHSNHQWKLHRYLRGNNVMIDESLQKTLDDFTCSGVCYSDVLEWLDSIPFAAAFRSNGQEYRCAHAYFSGKLYVPIEYEGVYTVNLVSRQMRDKLIYGVRNSNQERIEWWKESTERDWIRCSGHYHNLVIDYDKRSIVLDSSCGDENGKLSIFDVSTQTVHQF